MIKNKKETEVVLICQKCFHRFSSVEVPKKCPKCGHEKFSCPIIPKSPEVITK